MWAAVGIHPHDAAGGDELALAEIARLAAEPPVVAVGEIGLDYFRNLSPRDDPGARLPATDRSRPPHPQAAS